MRGEQCLITHVSWTWPKRLMKVGYTCNSELSLAEFDGEHMSLFSRWVNMRE